MAASSGPVRGRTDGDAYDDKTPGQWLALGLGVLFTLIGIVGFVVTGFDDFASNSDKTLLGLEINPLHNLVHLALGLLGLAMWRRRDTAKTYGWITFAGYAAVFLYGLVAAGDDSPNLLSLNSADNVFHFAVALVGVATALLADRERRPLATRRTRSA
jgi:hypothetical protein